MYQQTSRKICVICQNTRDNTYENPECKHNYCMSCFQNKKIIKVCTEKDCNSQINQNAIIQYFEKVQKKQNQEQAAQSFNNNSSISTQSQSSIKSSMINKSKQYASPNESIQQQQYSRNNKVDLYTTLNYCAICLFYMRDDLLKQQIQVKKNYPILDCQLHTICVGCFSNYFNHQKNRQYFCEICLRLIK
ncbi:unnamed protein product [Paramecium primaurelia]|uniref:Uncharacterized protein n=1 Tax=Paramecium primaurelia TaxID=5886 RepID=A0A8S1PU93_PARPR|nr:unnamed protein product [Paramecium primaurelia]